MDIHTLFDDKSDLYAKSRPQYPQELYEWLSGICPSNKSVWDVGCGNGQASVDLIRFFESVQSTDVSPSQIKNAPSINGITFSVQQAERTNFASQSFDAICVAQALHWFDYEAFWPEVFRVLKPEGVFCAWGYCWPHVSPKIDALLASSFLSVIRPYWPEQNKLLWDGYVDVPFPFKTRIATPQISLTMHLSIEQFFAYLHSWSATRRCVDMQGNAFFNASFNQISSVWGAAESRQISMDLVLIAGKNAS
ncbi:MAG: class I SAM-dependent methyltransferase [Pseudomonadota bacterium]